MPRSCREQGVHYVDVGTSGGVWGLERGYCMMIGGDEDVVRRIDPIFRCSRRVAAIFPRRRAAKAAIRASNRAICIRARSARGTS